MRDAVTLRRRDHLVHRGRIGCVRAGMRYRDAGERQSERLRLRGKQVLAHRVYRDSLRIVVHGREQPGHFEVLPGAQEVQRPGAVLAAGPGQENPLTHRVLRIRKRQPMRKRSRAAVARRR